MLHTTTIYITTFLVYICMTGILWGIWRFYSPGYKGVGLWACGMSAGVLAFPVIAAREYIFLPLSVVGGITLLPMGLACIIVGLERFFHLSPSTRLQVFFVLAVFAWQCVFLFVIDDVYARIAGFSLVVAIQIFIAVYRLFFDLAPGYRPMARLTAAVLLILGFIFTERVFFALPYLGSPAGVPTFDPTRTGFIFFMMILSIVLVFSFVLMLFRRQTLALEQKTGELKDYQASLEKMVEEKSARLAEAEKMASMGILASGVGHEISNPNQVIAHNLSSLQKFMNMIVPLLNREQISTRDMEMITQNSLVPRISRGIEQAREASSRIARIVNDLRDFSQPDQETAPETHDLRNIIRSAVDFTEHYLRNRTSDFRLDLPDTPLDFYCQAHRMEQVVINLLKNAADALPSRSGSITLSAGKRSGILFIKVADTGVGIESGNLPRLTTPFYTTRRDRGGTGLGLYLAARIIEGYKGRINIVSEPEKGTVAEVILPQQYKVQDSDIDHR